MSNEPILKFSYTLSQQEVYDASVAAELFKTAGKRKYVWVAILAIVGVVNAILYFVYQRKESSSLLLSVVSFAMIAVVLLLPIYEMKKRARNNATTTPVPVLCFEDKLLIGEAEGQWEVSFDEHFKYKDTEKFLIVYSNKGRVAAFPKKDLTEEQLKELIKIFTTRN
ncbi:MAG: YcxB family protein [Oscillospiraceae bacterium]|jgi:hypothetical protein|nr:YcxB family protein [Oscillospiraceae bacterium]